MRKFKDVNDLVNTLKPDYPVYCIRPESIKISTQFFKKNFPGRILYAVKTNPNEKVLKHILSNGIKDFDVASINEIKLIQKLKPEAKEVIIEMVFQLGKTGVSKFKKMWTAFGNNDYNEAANQMLDSKWAKQTPSRAKDLSDVIKNLV